MPDWVSPDNRERIVRWAEQGQPSPFSVGEGSSSRPCPIKADGLPIAGCNHDFRLYG